MQYCGVCHAHLHIVRNDGWGNTVYPFVPGHEINGRVVAASSHVTCHKVDDIVSFCCIVKACQRCDACNVTLEQRCANGFVGAYNGEEMPTCGMAWGGYSDSIVVHEKLGMPVTDRLDPAMLD